MKTSRKDQILAGGMNALIVTDEAIRGVERLLEQLKAAREYNRRTNSLINREFYPEDTLRDLSSGAA